MKPRNLTVYSHYPERRSAPRQAYPAAPSPMPYLRLRGRWMEVAGFAIGDRVRIEVQPGRLIVTQEDK